MADHNQASDIRIERKGSVAILHIIGELDALTGPSFEEAALRQIDGGAQRCVVDLTAATFIDSIGVGALIRSHRTAIDRGSAVLIAGATGMIAQLIKITQLHRILKVFPTLPEAVAAATSDVQEG